MSINKPLATAYYMNEDLGLLWSQLERASAENHLHDCIDRPVSPDIRMLKDSSNTLLTHHRGIIAHYDHNTSTGPLERTNNKIKTLQQQASGL